MDTLLRTAPAFEPSLVQDVAALGLQISVEHDVSDWLDFIRTTEWPVANTSVDPAFHDFRPGEVVWLKLAQGPDIVGTQVIRTIDLPADRDYAGMIKDGTLFRGTGAKPLEGFAWLPGAADVPRMTGRIAQMSGLYIRPEWRRSRVPSGLRLVAAFARLTHSYCANRLAPDWSVSLLEERVASPRMMYDLYGYPHAAELCECWVDCFARNERVNIVWMAGAEIRQAVESRPQSAAAPHRRPSPAA